MIDEEVFNFLLARVEESKRAYGEARQEFWAVVGTPTGLPQPNGSRMIRAAGLKESFALNAYLDAMMRLSRYLLEGVIPEDLPEQSERTRERRSDQENDKKDN